MKDMMRAPKKKTNSNVMLLSLSSFTIGLLFHPKLAILLYMMPPSSSLTNERIHMNIKTFGFYMLLFIILLVGVKFYTTIYSFFPSIATGFVLTYLTYPIYRYFLKVSKRKTLSSLSVIFLIFVLILIPSILVVIAVQGQITALFNPETITTVQNAVINLQQFFSERFGIDIFERMNVNETYTQFAVSAQSALASFAPKVIISVTEFVLSTFIVFFLLYYLLINAEFTIETFREYFPLSNRNISLLLDEVGSGVRSLILGQLLIAMIQGGLGALGFLIFGVPGVFLWGFVMSVLSFIPFLGSFIIWIPAGIILLAQGNYFGGTGILIWGFSLVGTIDNLIRPKLTSSLGRIHPVTVLLGVFLGIKEWGVIGLVLGPLLITVFMALIRMFREEYLAEKQPA